MPGLWTITENMDDVDPDVDEFLTSITRLASTWRARIKRDYDPGAPPLCPICHSPLVLWFRDNNPLWLCSRMWYQDQILYRCSGKMEKNHE